MSKSSKNGVSPLAVIDKYGSDVARMHVHFLAGYEDNCMWTFNGIDGIVNFLDKVWGLPEMIKGDEISKEHETELNQLIKKAEYDYENLENFKLSKYIGKDTNLILPNFSQEYVIDRYFVCENFNGEGDAVSEFIESIKISDSVTELIDGAFADYIGLKKIEIGKNVSKIDVDDGVFDGCCNISSIIIDEENKKYKHGYGDESCNVIIECDNDEGDTLIMGCKNSIIPNGVKNIGKKVFFAYSKPSKITIPSSVEKIDENAFLGCYFTEIVHDPNLSNDNNWGAKIVVVDKTEDEQEDQGLLIMDNKVVGYDSSRNNRDDKSTIEIPDGIVEICDCAFEYNTEITSVILPDSITKIGNYAFSQCTNLIKINIPSNITSIGKSAFIYCYNLKDVTTPTKTITIGDYAFYGCYISNLKFKLSNSIKAQDWKPSTNFDYETDDGLIILFTSNSNYLNVDKNGIIFCRPKNNIITIPNTVTVNEKTVNIEKIYGSAFSHNNKLTKITIPNTVKTIGKSAFFNCYNLTSVTIEEINNVNIEDFAFYRCKNLNNVTLTNTSKNITGTVGKGAFVHVNDNLKIYIKNTDTQETDVIKKYKNDDNWKYYINYIEEKEDVNEEDDNNE